MNSGAGDSFDYCADLVRRLDEDLWLSAQYAAPALRRRLVALYALHLEIVEIPSKVNEATLGEIRLQWWREALAEIAGGGPVRAHPVIEAVRSAAFIDAPALAALNTAIEARSRLFYHEPFADVDDLAGWLRRSEAYLAPLALAVAGESAGEALETAAIAFALSRIGESLAPDLSAAIAERAKRLFMESRMALIDIGPGAAPAILHLALTRLYLSKQGPLSAIRRRVLLFSAMASGRI